MVNLLCQVEIEANLLSVVPISIPHMQVLSVSDSWTGRGPASSFCIADAVGNVLLQVHFLNEFLYGGRLHGAWNTSYQDCKCETSKMTAQMYLSVQVSNYKSDLSLLVGYRVLEERPFIRQRCRRHVLLNLVYIGPGDEVRFLHLSCSLLLCSFSAFRHPSILLVIHTGDGPSSQPGHRADETWRHVKRKSIYRSARNYGSWSVYMSHPELHQTKNSLLREEADRLEEGCQTWGSFEDEKI